MRLAIPIRRLAAGTHLLNALLLAGFATAAVKAATLPPPPPSPAASRAVASVTRTPAAPEAPGSEVIAERGLFGRAAADGPSAPAHAPTGAPPGPPPALVGTSVGPRGGAAVFAGDDGQQRLVAAGEPVDDEWRLVAVRRGSAVVEHRSGRREAVPMPLSVLQPGERP